MSGNAPRGGPRPEHKCGNVPPVRVARWRERERAAAHLAVVGMHGCEIRWTCRRVGSALDGGSGGVRGSLVRSGRYPAGADPTRVRAEGRDFRSRVAVSRLSISKRKINPINQVDSRRVAATLRGLRRELPAGTVVSARRTKRFSNASTGETRCPMAMQSNEPSSA